MVWAACSGTRVFIPLSSTITLFSNRIRKTASKPMDHFKRAPDHGASQLSVYQLLILSILSILSIHDLFVFLRGPS